MFDALAAVTHDDALLGWTAATAVGTILGAAASAAAAIVAVVIANRARTEAAFLRLQRQRDEALRVEISTAQGTGRARNSNQPPLIQWGFNVSNLGSSAIRNVGGCVTTDGAAYSVMPLKVVPAGARGYLMFTEWAPQDDAGGPALVTLWFENSSGTWWELREGWADKRDGPGPYSTTAPRPTRATDDNGSGSPG